MGKKSRQQNAEKLKQNQMASSSSAARESHSTSNDEQRLRLIKEKEKEEEIFGYAMQLVNGSVLPTAMNAAIQLGVFDILANAGDDAALSAEDIAAQMPIAGNPEAPAMLDRICSLLVYHCVLGCCSVVDRVETLPYKRLYRLAPVSKHFVRNENGVSLAPLMALVHDEVFLNSGSKLKDAVLEGGVPFNRFHGMNFYDYLGRDARFSQVFNTAMFNHTTILVKKILESYDGFKNFNQVVDVGGGIGVALSLITSKYPKIKGINFDLPHVIQHSPPFPGVKHVAGNMFESVPKGDAIFLKWILHDWSDDLCSKLLKNCYEALPRNGKVIVVEQVLPIYPEITTVAKGKSQLDVLMMTQNPGGKERLQNEILGLALGAGFQSIGFVHHVCNTWVLEFNK